MNFVGKIFSKFKESNNFILELRNICNVGIALLKGVLYIIWYRIFRRNVIIKFPFMVYAPIKIIGNGSVYIGKGCSVFYSKHHGLTIYTLSKNAEVNIGEGCDLGGLTIRCISSVNVGDHTMTAVSLIQDVFIVNVPRNYSNQSRGDIIFSGNIMIGRNVWLGGQVCVLSGSNIGDGCVLSASSCILDTKTSSDCLLVGNPVRRGMPIKGLLKFRGKQ
ncbi:MAG TPA: hypothetical protein PLX41_07095 [Bacteroidales bacterium]|nr:hypothetical protein [Bacteroidales bacterium]